MNPQQPKCAYCGRSDAEVPLVGIRTQDAQAWICTQHLPVLIHKPHLLVGKLPGVENATAGEHEH